MTNVVITLGLIIAIHGVESGYAPVSKRGDGGRAVGPLQLHAAAVNDAWGNAVKHYSVTDEGLAYNTAYRYLKRYNHRVKSLDDVAKLYNGGPKRPKCRSTIRYASRLKLRQREVELAAASCLRYLDGIGPAPKSAAEKAVWRAANRTSNTRNTITTIMIREYGG